jgi:transcriptional regulator with XRE-family HTH domain
MTLGQFLRNARLNQAGLSLEEVVQKSKGPRASGKAAFSKSWLSELEKDVWPSPPWGKLEKLALVLWEKGDKAANAERAANQVELRKLWEAHVELRGKTADARPRSAPKLAPEAIAFYFGRHQLLNTLKNDRDMSKESKERLKRLSKSQEQAFSEWPAFNPWLVKTFKTPMRFDQVLQDYFQDEVIVDAPWIWAVSVEVFFTDPFSPSDPLTESEWVEFNKIGNRQAAVESLLESLKMPYEGKVHELIVAEAEDLLSKLKEVDGLELAFPLDGDLGVSSYFVETQRKPPVIIRGDSLAGMSGNPAHMGGLHLIAPLVVPNEFSDLELLACSKGNVRSKRRPKSIAQNLDPARLVTKAPTVDYYFVDAEIPSFYSPSIAKNLVKLGSSRAILEILKLAILSLCYLKWSRYLQDENGEDVSMLEPGTEIASNLVYTVGMHLKEIRAELESLDKSMKETHASSSFSLGEIKKILSAVNIFEEHCARAVHKLGV